jgi:YfiH family protein
VPASAGPFAGVEVRHSTRGDGDYRPGVPPAVLAARQRALADVPWVWVRQVHGAGVVAVNGRDPVEVCGVDADALVTERPGIALSVRTADCAPVVLASAEGPFGVAHAGWGGVERGVVQRAVEALRRLGAVTIGARIGPCIEGACYEFGAADLDRLALRYGDVVRCTTRWGTPGLDLAAAVTAACAEVDVDVASGPPACTACHAGAYWSHRARAEPERMATVVWRPLDDPGGGGGGRIGPA